MVLALLGLAAETPAQRLDAQPLVPPQALAARGPLDDVIRQGELLERERRWSDALSFYEEAVRSHPERNELQNRLVVARAHLDIARRFADSSYLASLERLSEPQALELYSEVLLKVDTYHVHEPNWRELVARGALQLDIAVTEPAFADRFPQLVSLDGAATRGDSVQAAVQRAEIASRRDAVDAVASLSRLAARQLGVSPQVAVLEFTCAAAAALDQYSAYLTGNQLDEVFSQIEGNFVGLGIELKAEEHSLLIVNVIPGGPAAEAGVLAQERIVAVDGMSTQTMSADTAADRLKGPELSLVEIALQDPAGAVRTLRLQRRRVDVPSVQDVQMLDATCGVAYLKLTSFQKNTNQDVERALWSLYHQGMRSLIVDVRGNPGGLLNAAVEVADQFLSSGVIVSTRGRSSREDFDYRAQPAGTWRVPLVVLIDGDSASASEIFAAAMHDYRRGTVVGQRSYGKGSVQGIFPLNRYKSGIRLTTSKFYAPSGQAISDRGVTPHVAVPIDQSQLVARVTDRGQPIPAGVDRTLATGLDLARQAAGQPPVGRAN
jgi:carboxyl-terminal processing protease